MKKLLLFVLFALVLASGFHTETSSEPIQYPFDSITIVSAFKFDITFDADPAVDSFLHGFVTNGETATVYVGNLTFASGGASAGDSMILIVTNAVGTDVLKWIINSYSLQPDLTKQYEFSSHITVDPEIGIVKEPDSVWLMATLFEYSPSSFALKDNMGTTYPMVEDSLEIETDLDIVIAAYTEDGE